MSDFFVPQNNLLGNGAIEKLAALIGTRGYNRCLIVTDAFMFSTDVFKRVLAQLVKADCAFKYYKDTKPNPTLENVEQVFQMIDRNAAAEACDFIVSVGGGSSHDLAKAVAILATNGGSITDYVGVNKLGCDALPIVAVNTTAGTGSEVTAFTIITDTKSKVKLAIVDKKMTPWISVNDPSAMASMPPKLTVETGIDALTHAIEAYVSTNSSPVTDACALQAIRLIQENIGTAFKDGSNLQAREKMAEASHMAGMAFSNASLGYVHAIAHQLGGIYDLPHGRCNAVLLPYLVGFNGTRMQGNRFGDIAEALGIQVFNKNNKYSHKSVADNLFKLNKSFGIPLKLKELGVRKEDFEMIAVNALKDSCSLTNPVQTDVHGIIGILNNAY